MNSSFFIYYNGLDGCFVTDFSFNLSFEKFRVSGSIFSISVKEKENTNDYISAQYSLEFKCRYCNLLLRYLILSFILRVLPFLVIKLIAFDEISVNSSFPKTNDTSKERS